MTPTTDLVRDGSYAHIGDTVPTLTRDQLIQIMSHLERDIRAEYQFVTVGDKKVPLKIAEQLLKITEPTECWICRTWWYYNGNSDGILTSVDNMQTGYINDCVICGVMVCENCCQGEYCLQCVEDSKHCLTCRECTEPELTCVCCELRACELFEEHCLRCYLVAGVASQENIDAANAKYPLAAKHFTDAHC